LYDKSYYKFIHQNGSSWQSYLPVLTSQAAICLHNHVIIVVQ